MRQALLLNYLNQIALCSLLTLHYLVGWGMHQNWNNASQDADGAAEVAFFFSTDSEDSRSIASMLLLEEDKEEEVEGKIKVTYFNIPAALFSLNKATPSLCFRLPCRKNEACSYKDKPRWLILRKIIV